MANRGLNSPMAQIDPQEDLFEPNRKRIYQVFSNNGLRKLKNSKDNYYDHSNYFYQTH